MIPAYPTCSKRANLSHDSMQYIMEILCLDPENCETPAESDVNEGCGLAGLFVDTWATWQRCGQLVLWPLMFDRMLNYL